MTDFATHMTAEEEGPTPVLGVLTEVSRDEGLEDLAGALVALRAFVGRDLADVEHELQHVPHHHDVVGRSLQHLLTLEGKRLRPMCVALGARFGESDPAQVVQLATAVELVHSATLLHDDVVDDGSMRRGRPTARVLYGNAASVFAGDWLLIEALRRVQQAGLPALMDSLLTTIDEMIKAEALQLESRGRLVFDEQTYYAVIEGKTASLFRWAMQAGAHAGQLSASATEALMAYGNDLGLAFQIVDDVLDIDGDAAQTGKALFTDLFEGKMTFPILVGAARDPEVERLVGEVVARGEGLVDPSLTAEVVDRLRKTEALAATRDRATMHAERARDRLAELPEGPARRALALVAEAAVRRSK